MQIRAMTRGDWPDVARIYGAGIESGNATFETEVPEWPAWDADHLPFARLVASDDVGVVGWTALAAVSRRPVYRGVAEHSIYVDAARRGEGLGRRLLMALIEESERAGVWTLQTAIFPENEASIALHASSGFRTVGTRELLGFHVGRWRDVILMERRSRTVGV